MKSNVIAYLKLFIPAGGATITPPLGPILSQYGVNTLQFCKLFNEKTINFKLFFYDYDLDFYLITNIHIYNDKTFDIYIKKPSINFLLKVILKINKVKFNIKFYLHYLDLIEIAKFKFPNLNLYSSCMIVRGVARSLNIYIKK